MWRAVITLVLGVIVAGGAIAALIYLNKSEFTQDSLRGAFELDGTTSADCRIENVTIEAQPPFELIQSGDDWLTTLFVKSNCDRLVFRVPVEISEGGALSSDKGCTWRLTNSTEERTDPHFPKEKINVRVATSQVMPSAARCRHILVFGGQVERANWHTNRLMVGLPKEVPMPTVSGKGLEASIQLSHVWASRGLRFYSIRLTDRDRESQLQVANIAISTLLGVGVAAVFEALLLLTAVSLIDKRIREHSGE